MNLEYALTLLKNEKESLLVGLDEYEKNDNQRVARMIKPSIRSLDSAIEILEKYKD